MSIVGELIGGDLVQLAGRTATFVGRSDHPRYPLLALVVWRLDDGTVSLDALDLLQEVGDVVSPRDGWEKRILAALHGEANKR